MKLSSIQYLRGLAAAGVVLSHASTSLFDGKRAVIPLSTGGTGVDLFFVISGFIMFYTTADDKIGFKDFCIRRVVRIVPIYFIFSSLAFIMASANPHLFNTFSSELMDYIRSLLFIPFYNHKLHAIQPEIGQGWTLDYEMFFYAIFAVSLLLRRASRLPICIGVFSLLVLLGILTSPTQPIAITYTNSIMFEFILGMTISYFLTDFRDSFGIFTVILLSAGFVAIILYLVLPFLQFGNLQLPRVITAGMPCAAIVAGMLWLERAGRLPELPLIFVVGDASYSLYLCHGFVLGILKRIWIKAFNSDQLVANAAFIALGTVAAIVVSLWLFARLEKPITTWLMGCTRHLRGQA